MFNCFDFPASPYFAMKLRKCKGSGDFQSCSLAGGLHDASPFLVHLTFEQVFVADRSIMEGMIVEAPPR